MNTDPYTPAPADVDHPAQSKLAMQVAAMNAAAKLMTVQLGPYAGGHIRSGVTKNKMRPRDKARVRMARESRRRNRR